MTSAACARRTGDICRASAAILVRGSGPADAARLRERGVRPVRGVLQRRALRDVPRVDGRPRRQQPRHRVRETAPCVIAASSWGLGAVCTEAAARLRAASLLADDKVTHCW